MAEKLDLLITEAKVIDGTGNPYTLSDVGVSGGRISLIESRIEGYQAARTIKAGGRVLCPGFIDTHTHDDMYLMAMPTCDDKVLQGVTTVVIGNCGQSTAPISDEHEAEYRLYTKVVEKYLKAGDLELRSFDDFLKKLERAEPGINVTSLVGHSTVRLAVMGLEARAPTEKELAGMKAYVAEAMQSGACGFSSGLIYAPGNYADVDEVSALAEVAALHNGIYTTHMRNEGDTIFPALEEAFEIGRRARIPVHISHHKLAGRQNWGLSEKTLQAMAEARKSGVTVTCDQYPYQAGSTLLLAALPPSALAEGERLFSELLTDRAYRSRLIDTIEKGSEKGWENLVKGSGFDGIMIAIAPRHPQYVGRTIAEIAETEQKEPYDLFFDLLLVERHSLNVILFMMGEEDIQRIMRSPLMMVGSDGIPGFGVEKIHPRQTGTFPRVLGRYVREKGILKLEEAIRKMTSFPAQTFRLKRKGIIREGFDADLVLFDPDTIIDRSTYKEPNQAPEGISHVIVNGVVAAENREIQGATSGMVLRRGINS